MLSIMVGTAWWQELGTAGHRASAVRKRRLNPGSQLTLLVFVCLFFGGGDEARFLCIVLAFLELTLVNQVGPELRDSPDSAS